ncbi:MAG: DeoR/GlpR transcriptional regulator [Clostridia bacterium]|nr:DeoR/GlpR transcriptional regulator [Clostridia bacterium]
MLALERRNAILEKLALTGKVIVADLSREFNVTEETIRRDLEKLDHEGLAQKTYGGAVSNHSLNMDLPYKVRQRTNAEAKQAIALKVADMIHDGDYVMMDASSTTLYITKCIRNKHNITLITNSIEILMEVADHDDWHVISTGGVLKTGALALLGGNAEKTIRNFRVDMAICSCKGVDKEFGISDSNDVNAQIKKSMFAAAKKRVLVVDHSKFDQTSFVKVGDLTDIDMIVTDQKPSADWTEACEDAGVTMVY